MDGWGRDKFMLNTMLYDRDFGFCVGDVVIFKVEISVCGELEPCNNSPSDFDLSSVSLQGQSLIQCMKTLLSQALASDVELIVVPSSEGTQNTFTNSLSLLDKSNSNSNAPRIPCHRCVLMARSPVFQAMLSHTTMEKLTGEITICDSPLPAVREMLHFIYCGELSSMHIMEELGEHLLAVAMKYQVAGLIQACEAHFGAQLNEDNAVDVLRLADGLNSICLKEKTLQFIGRILFPNISQF